MKSLNKKVLAIIPARGGSKGIPLKNIYPVNGKPLIAYSIESAIKSMYITKTVVSSENENILNIASSYGASILKRPENLATDNASSEAVAINCIEQLAIKGEEYDIIVLLQPTSPLRETSDIDNSLITLVKSNATALISVYIPKHSPFKSFKQKKDGFIEGIVDNKSPFMPRQELPEVFVPNGAIYIIYINEFMNTKMLFTDKTIPFIMSLKKSIDIDCLDDIYKCEEVLKENKK